LLFKYSQSYDDLHFYKARENDATARNGTYFLCGIKQDTISFAGSFTKCGVYVFADCVNFNMVCPDIIRVFENFPDTVFLWIENPDEDYHKWNIRGICGKYRNNCVEIIRSFGFILGEYTLYFAPQARVSISENGFVITDNAVVFYAPGAELPCKNIRITPVIKNSLYMWQIVFEGLFENTVNGGNIFEKIGAGIRFSTYFDETNTTDDNKITARNNGFIHTLYNSVLNYSGEIVFNCLISPNYISDNYLKIPANMVFQSPFVDVNGIPLSLQSTDNSLLVFHRTPHYVHSKNKVETTYQLGINGNFVIQNGNLLCGVNGGEFFATNNTTLSFVTGNAFIENNEITAESQTSHIKMSAGTVFYAQPKTAPFFKTVNNALEFCPMPLCTLSENTAPVPIMPYKDCNFNFGGNEVSAKIENVIAEKRHKVLTNQSQLPLAMNNATAPNVISTQGFFVWYNDNNWQGIGFGKTGTEYLQFTNITADVRSKFQENDLFIMYDSANPIKAATSNFELSINGFVFKFAPADWRNETDDIKTAMLIKYRTDKSINELMGNTPLIQTSLASCNDENGKIRPEFSDFVNKINNKEFQGVIFLNTKIIVNSSILPEIKLIIDGIEESEKNNLFAHHLIFPKNKVTANNGIINIEQSLFSGVIDYKSKKHLSYDKTAEKYPDAGFMTTSFAVVIGNSELKSVKSASELLINKLFAETPAKKSEGGNCLIIDGLLCKQNNENIFRFSLRGSGIYDLQGMLKHVAVNSVSLAIDANSKPCFSLNGRLYFMYNQIGDMFCYGITDENNADYDNSGLLFNNLVISSVSGELKLSYDNLYFDVISSIARDNSMVKRFPYELESLTYSEKCGNKSPKENDFTAITSPQQQSLLSSKWYGLVWNVPLGTLGDLSENETLGIKILTAWSPQSGCYIGVKLPFGANGFDVQGFLKLGFKSIIVNADYDKAKNIVDFSIILSQFAVSVLSFAFPPGNNRIIIKADESGRKLGWFAGYEDDVGNEYGSVH
jgi:hypothetical protein